MNVYQGPPQSLYSNYNPATARPNQTSGMSQPTPQQSYNGAYSSMQNSLGNQQLLPRPTTSRYRQPSPRATQRPPSGSNLSTGSLSQPSQNQSIAIPQGFSVSSQGPSRDSYVDIALPTVSQSPLLSYQTRREAPVISDQFSISNDQPTGMIGSSQRTNNLPYFPTMSVIKGNGNNDTNTPGV